MSHLTLSQEIYTTISTVLRAMVTGVFDKLPSE